VGARYFGIAPLVAVAGTFAIVIAAFALGRYRLWERVVIGLALGNCIFIPAALFAHADPQPLSARWIAGGPAGQRPSGAVHNVVHGEHRRDRHALDDFLSAECRRRQRLTRADLGQARVDTLLGATIRADRGDRGTRAQHRRSFVAQYIRPAPE